MMDTVAANETAQRRPGAVAWVKRLGVAGFLFFFLKGMLWLIVPAVLVWGEGCLGPG